MSDESPEGHVESQLSISARIDLLCDRFESAWQHGERPRIEDCLEAGPPSQQDVLFRELLEIELQSRHDASEALDAAEYRRRFPQRADTVDLLFHKVVNLRRLGDYELLEELGSGGMGVVYRARHLLLNQIVALKVLPERYLDEPQAVSRFRREMQSIGALEHPNIVRAYNAGESGGVHFLVMEFVDGINLQKLVTCEGPLEVGAACEVVRQAALGLQHAHEHNLVHRDIKPANLVLSRSGVVKILDLGLARFHADRRPSETRAGSLTQAGMTLGTVDYMAPEQGEDSSGVDIRADIYSLGCTLFYLLTGEPPYGGKSYDSNRKKLMAHVVAPIPVLSERCAGCPDGLEAVFEQMLAKEPDARFGTPGEVVEAFEQLADPDGLVDAVAAALNRTLPRITSQPSLKGSKADTAKKVYRLSGSHKGRSSSHRRKPTAWYRRARPVAAAVAGLLALAAVAFWLGRSKPAPADTGLRNELALLPALNGDWWFDEMPWMAPFMRRAMSKAVEDPQNLALLTRDLPPGERPLTDPNVRAVRQRLLALAQACRDGLRPSQRDLFDDLAAVSSSDFDETKTGSHLEKALARFVQQPDEPGAWQAVDLHTKAVLEHKLAALGNDQRWATKAHQSYKEAIEKYGSSNGQEPPLQLLAQADLAELIARYLGAPKTAGELKERYAKVKERCDKALAPGNLPVLFRVDVLVNEGRAANLAGQEMYGDSDYAFQTAEKLMEDLDDHGRDHPLRAYVYEEYAWCLTDRWMIGEAEKKFTNACLIRQRGIKDQVSLQLQEGDNEAAQAHVFHDLHGLAILARYKGNARAAQGKFRSLLDKIRSAQEAFDAEGGGFAGAGRQRYLGKLVERLYNSSERCADCVLYEGAASNPKMEGLARACELYKDAYDNAQDPALRIAMACKLAIAFALGDVPPKDIRDQIPDGDLRKTVSGEESERTRLLQQVANNVLAFKEDPAAERKDFAGFLGHLVNGEFSTSDKNRREAFELQLLCAELLISSDLQSQATAEVLLADVEHLDNLLLSFPARSQTLPFLRRYYDLAINAVGGADPDRLARFILWSRGESRSEGTMMVLFYLEDGDGDGVAVVVPSRPQETCARIALGVTRKQIKGDVKRTPRKLPEALAKLVKPELAAGRVVDVRWSDEKCWADAGQALSDKHYPYRDELPLRTPAAAR